MVKVNEHYLELPGNYLFSVVAERVRSFQEDHPEGMGLKRQTAEEGSRRVFLP